MQSAFLPLGNTVAITAAASPPTGVTAGASPSARSVFAGQYRVMNAGSIIVHLGVGATAGAAQTAAAAATSGNPAAGIPILPGAVEVLTFNADAFFSALAASNTTVYITPGQGL